MYIKEVIIEGFKSYAQRTHIKDFDPLFNAITGLNGSGKSNILDSICFVLGISNLSQVRATNLQELVYKNGQAGITKASVTIVFDNSDKNQAPVGYENFDDLTVTRQVVVGGRNRYLINGSNANNNRVSDLFRSVQLNINNPHFLIMQGRITKVLNMKPREILSMIEEAAGTSLYETKKLSALKTIEKKDKKLEDINSILAEELHPTLEKLKAERASYLEYQKIQRQIEALTRLVVAYKYTRARDLDSNAEKEVEDLQTQITELDGQVEASKARVEELKGEIKRLEQSKKSEACSSLQQLEGKMSELSKAEVKARSDLESVHEAVKDEEKEKERVVQSIASTENLIKTKSEELVSAREEAEKLREAETNEREAVEKAVAGLDAVRAGQMQNEEGECITYTEHLIKLKDQLSEASTANQQAKLKIKHFASSIKKMESTCKNAEREIAKEKGEFESANKVVSDLEKRMERLGFSADQFTGLQERKVQLENSIAASSRQVNDLVGKYPQLSFDYTSPTAKFDRRRVKGLLVDLFTVKDADFAMALEVAAGGKLYNVVTDNEETASQLIAHGQLRKRYTMVPLSKIRGAVIDRKVVEAAQGLVGKENCVLALDAITYEKEVDPAMRYCFGGVLICRTKEQAKRVAFHRSVKRTVITLEGDVFDPAGTLTGGSRDTSRCVLRELMSGQSARSELSQLKEEHRNLSRQLQGMASQHEKWEQMSGELRLKQHERALIEDRLKQTSHYKDIEELKKTKEDLAAQEGVVAGFSERESTLLAQVKEIEGKMRNFKAEQAKEVKRAEKRIAEARARLGKVAKESKERENRAKELELEVGSALVKELEGLRGQLPAADEAIRAAREKVAGAEDKLGGWAARREALETELEEARRAIAECSAEIEALAKEEKAAEKVISGSGVRHKELTHKLTKLNKEAAEARNQVEHYREKYEWIETEERYFGQPDTAYDFGAHDIKESGRKLEKLEGSKEQLSKSVNMRAMHLLGEAEKRYSDLVKRKEIVEGDKRKINHVIVELDEKKNKAVKKAWEQVNKDFGSIFSTLLPGARARLQTLEGMSVTEGLEVKVGFGDVWKETLAELSGGQRSLVALSLILSLLLFKPAPLYILDEVDAALDLSHTQNIGQMLRAHFKKSQFIVVSLKDGMFQNANVLFRTKFVEGVSTVTRHGQTAAVPSDKENMRPLPEKKKRRQQV